MQCSSGFFARRCGPSARRQAASAKPAEWPPPLEWCRELRLIRSTATPPTAAPPDKTDRPPQKCLTRPTACGSCAHATDVARRVVLVRKLRVVQRRPYRGPPLLAREIPAIQLCRSRLFQRV